jgi:hypothetical protein
VQEEVENASVRHRGRSALVLAAAASNAVGGWLGAQGGGGARVREARGDGPFIGDPRASSRPPDR